MGVRPLPVQSKWFKAQVNSQVALRSYIVCTEDGRLKYHQNYSHLYKVPESFQVLPDKDKIQLKVDTQTRWIPRRPTEETPQLQTPQHYRCRLSHNQIPSQLRQVFLCLSLLEVTELLNCQHHRCQMPYSQIPSQLHPVFLCLSLLEVAELLGGLIT